MPRVLFADGNDGEPIAATLRRQIKVNDFGELSAQDRYKDFIERNPEDGWLIRRFTGVGGVVDWVATHGDTVYGEDGEPIFFVVVASVIAKGSLECKFVVRGRWRVDARRHNWLDCARVCAGKQMTFKHDFCGCRHRELAA